MVVRKHGRTTGLTVGRVVDLSYDALVNIDPSASHGQEVRFVDQIRIEAQPTGSIFASGGDSGSLIVDFTTNAAVGLYFAGPDDGTYGVANRMEHIMKELEIRPI